MHWLILATALLPEALSCHCPIKFAPVCDVLTDTQFASSCLADCGGANTYVQLQCSDFARRRTSGDERKAIAIPYIVRNKHELHLYLAFTVPACVYAIYGNSDDPATVAANAELSLSTVCDESRVAFGAGIVSDGAIFCVPVGLQMRHAQAIGTLAKPFSNSTRLEINIQGTVLDAMFTSRGVVFDSDTPVCSSAHFSDCETVG